MNKWKLAVSGAIVWIAMCNSTMAQYFTNDLTDATSIAGDFGENLGAEGFWSYTNDYALAEDGTTNLYLLGGAILGPTDTNDIDDCRSYLTTDISTYLDASFKAHVAVESVTGNMITFGLGLGVPDTDYYYEPTTGEYAFLGFANGITKSWAQVKFRTSDADTATGSYLSAAGFDLYMTYNVDTDTLKFEVDDWSDGRYSGIDLTSTQTGISAVFSDANAVSIFFGGNATMTFRDFEVFLPDLEVAPDTPADFYAWPTGPQECTLGWDESEAATSYTVKRSTESGTGFVSIATEVTDLTYVDTDVVEETTYYYTVSAVNAYGESSDTAENSAVLIPYTIIGTDPTSVNLSKYELFDGDTDTIFDLAASGYAGLDYGVDNAQQLLTIRYFLRDDSWGNKSENDTMRAVNRSVGFYFEGSDSEDFSESETLYTLTTNSLQGSWNEIAVSSANTFRYVRLVTGGDYASLNVFAELDFVTPDDYTESGTPKYWLSDYDLVTDGDYESADLEDSDGDGLLAWEEYVAGTIPTNAASVLELNSISNTVNGLVLSWQSVEGKSYRIVTNTSLTVENPGTVVSGITGLDGETSYTIPVSGASSVFYEIGVE
jgi:hypothetical protein